MDSNDELDGDASRTFRVDNVHQHGGSALYGCQLNFSISLEDIPDSIRLALEPMIDKLLSTQSEINSTISELDHSLEQVSTAHPLLPIDPPPGTNDSSDSKVIPEQSREIHTGTLQYDRVVARRPRRPTSKLVARLGRRRQTIPEAFDLDLARPSPPSMIEERLIHIMTGATTIYESRGRLVEHHHLIPDLDLYRKSYD